jgi:hypothetical protein
MLKIEEFAPLFLKACPNARPAWEKLHQQWPGRTNLYFLEVAGFCSHLVGCTESSDIESLQRAFQVVELFMTEGDEEVCTFIEVGLLQGLQHLASSKEYGPEAFEPYLGRRTLAAWNELE